MKKFRWPHLLFGFSALICFCNLTLYFHQINTDSSPSSEETFLTQNTYFGPKEPIPGDPQLIRVELLIKDSAALSGVQIQSVTFDGQSVPLKPRDIFGKRGSASFQLAPGKYTLRWRVDRDKMIWPRTITHEEEVLLDPRDLWIQILIEGDQASIR